MHEKSFPHTSPNMCKTVENSVDYAENLYFRSIFRLFSPFYARNLWKTFFAPRTLFILFFVSFYNFYKTIDFL